jgi:hypothetical protein
MLHHHRPIDLAAGAGAEVAGGLVDWVARSAACLHVS